MISVAGDRRHTLSLTYQYYTEVFKILIYTPVKWDFVKTYSERFGATEWFMKNWIINLWVKTGHGNVLLQYLRQRFAESNDSFAVAKILPLAW